MVERASLRRRNPRKQGLIGLSDAIAWFSAHGYAVALPLDDSQKYDLVVEDPQGVLLKVQVKTTTYRNARGRFAVSIVTNGGNRSRQTDELFDPSHYDLLYILTEGDGRYLVPAEAITARRQLVLGERMRPYRVAGSCLACDPKGAAR